LKQRNHEPVAAIATLR